MRRRRAQRRALERREHVGEALPLVVALLRVRRSESKFDRYMTNIATPAATTIAIASAWPFICHRSRSSLRLSAVSDHRVTTTSSRGASLCGRVASTPRPRGRRPGGSRGRPWPRSPRCA